MVAPSQALVLRHSKRDHSLGVFEPVTGSSFLEALCDSYNGATKSIQHHDQVHKSVELFIGHLKSAGHRLLAQIKDGHRTYGDELSWLLATSSYASMIDNLDVGPSSKNKHLSGLNYWTGRMQSQGYIPRFNKLPTKKNPAKVSDTLLDFTYSEVDLNELGVDTGDSNETQEVDRMLESISTDLGFIDYDNLSDQAALVLKKRLSLIRSAADKAFNNSKKKRLDGLRLIRKYRCLLPLVDRWVDWVKAPGAGSRNPYAEDVRTLSGEAWWGAYLAWCWYRNSGLEPKDAVIPTRIYNKFRKEFGARGDFRADIATAEALGCTAELIAAVSVILIHDLVANVDSVRNIGLHADRVSDYGIIDIAWVKLRSKGLLTAMDSAGVENSPSHVIRVVRKATRNYRKACPSSHSDNLFLHHHSAKGRAKHLKHDTVRPMTPSSPTVLNYIKEIIGTASGGKWLGTARSIRTSILLHKGLIGGLIAVQLAAQHKNISTSQQYANKAPMLLGHDKKMREFKEWMQAMVTIQLDDVPAKLGINEDDYKKRKEEILSSRFGGLYCRDAFSGFQPGTREGSVCGKIGRCMTCDNRRHIFIASEDNVVHVLHWNQALLKAQQDGLIQFENNSNWLFWCLFIESVFTKLTTGGPRYEALLAGAMECAGKTVNPYVGINFEDTL